MIPPPELWTVVFTEMTGWPRPIPSTLRTKQPRFATPEGAAKMLAVIESLPSHLTLIGVWKTGCLWEPVNVAELPEPRPVYAESLES